jgi:alkaline phosphatase D
MPIYRRITWGDLAELSFLDTRQYRDEPPCGYGEQQRCAAALDPRFTVTGPDQERWLLRGLDRSNARWNVIAQQALMAQLDHDGDAGDLFWNDSWDGFPAPRNRIIQHLHSRKLDNPVVITGDWHSTRSPTTSSSTSTTRDRRPSRPSSSRRRSAPTATCPSTARTTGR